MMIIWIIALIGLLIIVGPALAAYFSPMISSIICFGILLFSSPVFYLTAMKEIRRSRILDDKIRSSRQTGDHESELKYRAEKEEVETRINKKLTYITTAVFFAAIILAMGYLVYVAL